MSRAWSNWVLLSLLTQHQALSVWWWWGQLASFYTSLYVCTIQFGCLCVPSYLPRHCCCWAQCVWSGWGQSSAAGWTAHWSGLAHYRKEKRWTVILFLLWKQNSFFSGRCKNSTLKESLCFNSLVVDRYDGWVGEEICGSPTAVGTAHWLSAGWHVGRLNVDHLVTILLCGKYQQKRLVGEIYHPLGKKTRRLSSYRNYKIV